MVDNNLITTQVYLVLGTLALIFSFSLSFSLFQTHTHTETHTPASSPAPCSEVWTIWVVIDKSLKDN